MTDTHWEWQKEKVTMAVACIRQQHILTGVTSTVKGNKTWCGKMQALFLLAMVTSAQVAVCVREREAGREWKQIFLPWKGPLQLGRGRIPCGQTAVHRELHWLWKAYWSCWSFLQVINSNSRDPDMTYYNTLTGDCSIGLYLHTRGKFFVFSLPRKENNSLILNWYLDITGESSKEMPP